MTKEQRNAAIKRLNARGLKNGEIALKLAISRGTVWNVLNDYKHQPLKNKSEANTQPKKTKRKYIKRKPKATSTTTFSILWGLLSYTHTSFSKK